MKTTLLLCALATGAFAGPPVLTRITPADLAKLQQHSPMTRLQTPAEGEAVVSPANDQSIVKQSIILNDGKHWTLVPKGAVIFLPEAMKSRVNGKPVGILLTFTDFLTRNHAWVATNEVSFKQAAGSEQLPAESTTFWAKQDKVVIAVHQNGPISVRVANEPPTLTQR
jgi:hypothetical protein